MTIDEANRLFVSSLQDLYEEREAAAICSLVMEHITKMQKGQRVLHKGDLLSEIQRQQFEKMTAELLKHRPVQYVLNQAWFGGLSFFVNEAVLIPRPETEELVMWIADDPKSAIPGISLLDIGTGSGCIPIYLQSKRKNLSITAIDISSAALETANENSASNKTDINFLLMDIRDESQWGKVGLQDIIVSNPPYIPQKQKLFLDKHVRDFEPGLALFVPDDDPIVFYKIIGLFAKNKLKRNGVIFLEIHHDFAKAVTNWYSENGFAFELRKDISGNNRMIKAWQY